MQDNVNIGPAVEAIFAALPLLPAEMKWHLIGRAQNFQRIVEAVPLDDRGPMGFVFSKAEGRKAVGELLAIVSSCRRILTRAPDTRTLAVLAKLEKVQADLLPFARYIPWRRGGARGDGG